MKTTIEFIDAVKKRLNINSDNALRDVLGIKQQAISVYRTKRVFLGEDTAYRVAEILDLEPGYVLACVAAERAKSAKVRKAWEDTAKKISAAVITVFIGSFALSSALPGAAHAAARAYQCILCKIRRVGWIVGLLALLPCFSAQAAETWTNKEIAGEATFFALTAVDYLQTRWIATHTRVVTDTKMPGAVIETVTTRHEINPLIGPRPSLTRVTAVFAAEAAAQLVIAHYLPHPYRSAWIGATVAVELGFTAHNAAVGVRMEW